VNVSAVVLKEFWVTDVILAELGAVPTNPKVGAAPVLNCQPAGAVTVTVTVKAPETFPRSLLVPSVKVIVPSVVNAGVIPVDARLLHIFVPPVAAVTDICAMPFCPTIIASKKHIITLMPVIFFKKPTFFIISLFTINLTSFSVFYCYLNKH